MLGRFNLAILIDDYEIGDVFIVVRPDFGQCKAWALVYYIIAMETSSCHLSPLIVLLSAIAVKMVEPV